MAKGISIFLGMDYSWEQNRHYIQAAAAAGFSRIFTSLHIPEADYDRIIGEFKQFLQLAQSLKMAVTADISPNAYQYLGINADDLTALRELGIETLRLDYGFKAQRIANYSNNAVGLKIELNASTISEQFLDEIIAAGANPANLSACHNYYPRKNTGISLESLQHKNQLFAKFNIPLTAFISLPNNRRGLLYEGLPTVECLREVAPSVAMQYLWAVGVEHISIGDALASDEVVEHLGRLSPEIIELDVVDYNPSPVYQELLQQLHTNRPDSAADVVRSQESRLILLENSYKSANIPVENCVARPRGSITVDNNQYLRYCGELQIARRDLPADSRVNVIGQLSADSLLLLDFIGDSRKFRFKI